MLDLFIALAGGAYLAGKCANERMTVYRRNCEYDAKGYNYARQNQLDRMKHSADPEQRKQFDRLLGRTMNRNDGGWDGKLAVRQISLREGWTYLDYSHVGLALVGPENAARMNEETDRRKVWIDRCPHGHDVDLFPMDYPTEEAYREAVQKTYYRWRYLCKPNIFGISPYNYDTEAEYNAAVAAMMPYEWRYTCGSNIYGVDPKEYETKQEYDYAVGQREEYYEQYSYFRKEGDLLERMSAVNLIDKLDKQWYSAPYGKSVEYRIALVYVWIVEGRMCQSDKLALVSILRDKAAMFRWDLDEVLKKHGAI